MPSDPGRSSYPERKVHSADLDGSMDYVVLVVVEPGDVVKGGTVGVDQRSAPAGGGRSPPTRAGVRSIGSLISKQMRELYVQI